MSSKPVAELKIFDGTGFVTGPHPVSIIVAATSRASAIAALRDHGIRATESRVASHWRVVTEPLQHVNAKRYSLALAEPERPFVTSSYNTKDYKIVPRDGQRVPARASIEVIQPSPTCRKRAYLARETLRANPKGS